MTLTDLKALLEKDYAPGMANKEAWMATCTVVEHAPALISCAEALRELCAVYKSIEDAGGIDQQDGEEFWAADAALTASIAGGVTALAQLEAA